MATYKKNRMPVIVCVYKPTSKYHNEFTKIQASYWVKQISNRFALSCVFGLPSETLQFMLAHQKLNIDLGWFSVRNISKLNFYLHITHSWNGFKLKFGNMALAWIWDGKTAYVRLDLTQNIYTSLFRILWARSRAIFLRTWMKNLPNWIPQSCGKRFL